MSSNLVDSLHLQPSCAAASVAEFANDISYSDTVHFQKLTEEDSPDSTSTNSEKLSDRLYREEMECRNDNTVYLSSICGALGTAGLATSCHRPAVITRYR